VGVDDQPSLLIAPKPGTGGLYVLGDCRPPLAGDGSKRGFSLSFTMRKSHSCRADLICHVRTQLAPVSVECLEDAGSTRCWPPSQACRANIRSRKAIHRMWVGSSRPPGSLSLHPRLRVRVKSTHHGIPTRMIFRFVSRYSLLRMSQGIPVWSPFSRTPIMG